MDEQDVVLGDDSYGMVGQTIKKSRWVCPRRETQCGFNAAVDKKCNEEQGAPRKVIETEISQIASNFHILSIPWKGSMRNHQQLVWIIAAIHNLIVDSRHPDLVQ